MAVCIYLTRCLYPSERTHPPCRWPIPHLGASLKIWYRYLARYNAVYPLTRSSRTAADVGWSFIFTPKLADTYGLVITNL
jgi:hypothetical protein